MKKKKKILFFYAIDNKKYRLENYSYKIKIIYIYIKPRHLQKKKTLTWCYNNKIFEILKNKNINSF
jgi:hypothetical protein